MKKRLEKMKNKAEEHDVKGKAKKVAMYGIPAVALTAIGYFGLKTSKDPNNKDWIGG